MIRTGSSFRSPTATATPRPSTCTPDGDPLRIVGPYGHTTEIELNGDGYVSSVTTPAGDQYSMTYAPRGLIATFTDTRGETSQVAFENGRLVRDTDPAGGFIDLRRELLDNGRSYLVTRTSAEGSITTYLTEHLSNGSLRQTNTFPDGSQATSLVGNDGTTTTTLPDGTLVQQRHVADPIWSTLAPQTETTTILPSGVSRTTSTTRTATTQIGDASVLASETVDQFVNARRTRTTYDGTTRTFTTTTPASRTSSRTIDILSRTTSASRPGFLASSLTYDARGRLGVTAQGTRSTLRTYFDTANTTNGYLATLTAANGITTSYTPDALGRTLFETTAATTTGFSWDPRSNLASVTPPGQPTHTQGYTPVNLLDTYTPPAAGIIQPTTAYTYDLDRNLTQTVQPGGTIIDRAYDSAGRLDLLTMPTGTIDYEYYAPDCAIATGCAPGRLATLTGPDPVSVAFRYNGPLTTTSEWSGDVTGAVSWTHDNDFRPITEAVTDGTITSDVAFGYDADSLLTCASPSTCAGTDRQQLTYNTASLLTATTLGLTSDTYSVQPVRRARELLPDPRRHPPVRRRLRRRGISPRPARPRGSQGRDALRRDHRTWEYSYDDLGRLDAVWEDGVLTEDYTYDANGNRLELTTPEGTVTGSYDDPGPPAGVRRPRVRLHGQRRSRGEDRHGHRRADAVLV